MNTRITREGKVYADLFSQFTENVKLGVDTVFAQEFDETGEEGKVQIFPGRIKAAMFCEFDGNAPIANHKVTFRVKSATPSTTERTINGSTNISDIQPEGTSWSNHGFLGWSETEYPSYSAISDRSAFVTQVDNSKDVELFAVYDTNFQGLIDEGFVTIGSDPNGLVGNPYIFVSDNHYPEELVTDFHEVFFNSSSEYYINRDSRSVGGGSAPNVFAFWQSGQDNHQWLSNHRWKELFESESLAYAPMSSQFRFIDWREEESVTIRHSVGGNIVSNLIFGRLSPRILNYDVDGAVFKYMNKTFGDTYGGCSSEEIHLTSSRDGGYVRINPGWANLGYNATFEGADNLKVLTGFDATGRDYLAYCFDGCRALETASADLLGASGATMLGSTNWLQTFAHCYALTVVEPILVVTGSTETGRAFADCVNLESVRIYGLNAALNTASVGTGGSYNWDYTWDFTDTKLDQASFDYMVANAVACDTSVQGFVYKTLGVPSNIVVTAAQQQDMYDKGWEIVVAS